jgi:hypothetical protein
MEELLAAENLMNMGVEGELFVTSNVRNLVLHHIISRGTVDEEHVNLPSFWISMVSVSATIGSEE